MIVMRAVTWEGNPYDVVVRDHPKPQINDPLDAIVRITTAAICGTDLHTYHGSMGSREIPWIMGHEAIGIVEEVGVGIKTLNPGDRVVVSASAYCGFCRRCMRQEFGFCLNINPPLGGGLFGFGNDFGPPGIGGMQAEYVRVPFADATCLVLPSGNDHELDYLMLADIWPTAWDGLDFARFESGDSVAVFGAGPVGLLCAYTAIFRGARLVYSIDYVPERLQKAESIGAIPINFTTTDPVLEILGREAGGVNRAVDCVGYECLNSQLERDDSVVMNQCIGVTQTAGGVGIVGLYLPPLPVSPGVPNADADGSVFPVIVGFANVKGLEGKGGAASIRSKQFFMRDLITAGRARPGSIVSKEISIEEAPEGYRRFSERKETKVAIRLNGTQPPVLGESSPKKRPSHL